MQSKYYFHELPHRENHKFFNQEGSFEFMGIRKVLVLIMIFVTVSDIVLRFCIFPLVVQKKQAASFGGTFYFLLIATILYMLTLSKVFQRKQLWLHRVRYCLYLFSALFNSVYIFLSVMDSTISALSTQNLENWTYGLLSILNCVHATTIIFLISPTWYFKVMIIGSCHVGMLVGYWTLDSPMKGWVMVKCIANLIYMSMYVIFGYFYRWRLFQRNSEAEGRVQVYNDILDRLLSMIAIVDRNGDVIYSNLAFKNLAAKNAKSLFTNIVNLKVREFPNRLGTAETHPQGFYTHGDPSYNDHRIESASGSSRHPLFKAKELLSSRPAQFQTLEKLIQYFTELINKEMLTNEDQIVFDAKMNKGLTPENMTLSYEVIVRPLLEQKKIILTLNNTTQRDLIASLEDNNEYKDKLLASVSHELRTPLNGNIGFLQAALYEETVPQSVKDKLLLPAFRSGKLLYHMINDILDYSKMQTEQIKLNLELKPLRETLEYCYQLLEHAFKRKNIEFNLSIDLNLRFQYRTDHDRLIQVTLNLLSNALKFTRKGKVSLEARACEESGVAEIIVYDTGMGIASKDICRLFEEHSLPKENEEEITPHSKGVGLGLKIANKLAKLLGSETDSGIKVTSVIGEGSVFSFKVCHRDRTDVEIISIREIPSDASPLSDRSITSLPEIPVEKRFEDSVTMKCVGMSKSLKKSQWTRNPAQQRMKLQIYSANPKVLVVDDDLINILALQHLLGQLQVESDVAYNGQEAIDKLLGDPQLYKLVFMDCQMPIMDGFEASKQILQKIKTGELPQIPIIGCTAFSSKEKIEECINCGMREVLPKPVLRDKLKGILAKYLRVA